MRYRGFTLVETLASVGILAALAAITFTVAHNAKSSASQANCGSNLKQFLQAVEIYRSDSDGSGSEGNLYQMGLPPFPQISKLSGLKSLKCSSTPSELILSDKMFPYIYVPVEPEREISSPTWEEYVRIFHDDVVFAYDLNHNPLGIRPEAPLQTKFGLGMTLSGHLVRNRRAGDAFRKAWWHQAWE